MQSRVKDPPMGTVMFTGFFTMTGGSGKKILVRDIVEFRLMVHYTGLRMSWVMLRNSGMKVEKILGSN